MYEPHESFTLPSESTKIWRYMDFSKFVSFLETQSLHFASADTLGDPYEFNIPVATRKHWEGRLLPHQKEMPRLIHELFQKSMYVNCWHINEHESAAMWTQYLRSNEGIAIQSTVKRLVGCFMEYPTDDVLIGQVRYIDYDSEEMVLNDADKLFQYILFKRNSYSHENELRAVICRQEIRKEDGKPFVVPPDSRGIAVRINDLTYLVESVYVAPTKRAWFSELVKKISARYGLDDVRQSCLSESPVW